MSPELELQLQQQLKLNPQLQQSLKLLQLSQLELTQEIQYQLETNPLLESEASDSDSSDLAANNQESTSDITELSTTAGVNSGASHSVTTNETNLWENIAEQADLKEKLEFQLQLHHLSRLDLEIGYYLIENLNERGFLTCSNQNICQQILRDCGHDVKASEVEVIRHFIQTLEPLGCASFDLQEFLLFQLKQQQLVADFSEKEIALAQLLLEKHFTSLAANQFDKIESRLDVSHQTFNRLLTKIQALKQRPCEVTENSEQQYIRPDIRIMRHNGRMQAIVTQQQLPKLRLNNSYMQMLKSVDDKDKKYLKNKAAAAQSFIQSLTARENTLQKVADFLLHHQSDYFTLGNTALKPLKLNDIAQALELHESTISRATSNKYCQTPHGVIKLKDLFSNAINNQKGGEWSQTAVKSKIQQLIKSEPSRKPLSDNSIVKLLAQQGISIARRTVAKYRDALQIPSASKRKQLSSL